MTSYSQDGGHDVRRPLAAACAVAPPSPGCLLTHRTRATLLARCICYSSWSIVHSYLFVINVKFYFHCVFRVRLHCFGGVLIFQFEWIKSLLFLSIMKVQQTFQSNQLQWIHNCNSNTDVFVIVFFSREGGHYRGVYLTGHTAQAPNFETPSNVKLSQVECTHRYMRFCPWSLKIGPPVKKFNVSSRA